MNLSWDVARSVLSAIRIPSETVRGIWFARLLFCTARSFSHPHSPNKPSPFQALLSPQVILLVLHCRWWSHRELFQPSSLFTLCSHSLHPVEDTFIHTTKASPPPCALPLGLLLLLSHWVMSDSLQPHGLSSARFLCPWDFPGKYWSGLPFPSPGDLLHPGIEPESPALAGRFFYHWATREAPNDLVILS